MAMQFPFNTNISGTITSRQLSDSTTFGEHYKARVSNTGEHVIHRSYPPMSLNVPNAIPPCYEEHSERIMAIHLPESKLHELVSLGVSEVEELELRRQNPELDRLYHQYKMMVNLYK